MFPDRSLVIIARAVCALVSIACSSGDGPATDRSQSAEARDASLEDASPSIEETRDAATVAQDAARDPSEPEPEPTGDAEPEPQAAAADTSVAEPPDAGADSARPLPDDDDAGVLDAAAPEPEPDPAIDPALAAQIEWVLATLNEGGTPSNDALREHFSPSFLAEIPLAQLAATFEEISSQLRPVTVAARTVRGLEAQVRLDTADGQWLLRIGVTNTRPRQINLAIFEPAPIEAASYGDVVEALQPLAANVQLLVARVSGEGRCTPIAQHAPDERLAIGSAFKLWVLLALSEKLEDDPTVSWTTRLPIRDELKSLPSGILQNQPAGALITLDEYASRMIEISDNTATDHLIDYLGRTTVEAALVSSGHSNPAANIPLLMTRELFVLKLALPDAEVDAFRAASVPERRALLDAYRNVPLTLEDAADWMEPRALDLEWFATPMDLCNVLGALGVRADFTPSSQLLRILGTNPGITVDPTQWRYVGYKGGSEVGVLNTSWLLQRADGAWFSIVVTLNDSEQALDTEAIVSALTAILPLVAAESGG